MSRKPFRRSSCRLSACRVFQSRRLRLQFLEVGERGVEVGLVEDLDTVERVAFDHQKRYLPPLGIKAFSRGPACGLSDDRSEVGEPMNVLGVQN